MAGWMQWAWAGAAFLALAPLVGWLGRRYGRNIKGGVALAAVLLGMGQVMDPPSKHAIEAVNKDEEGAPTPGEPPLDA